MAKQAKEATAVADPETTDRKAIDAVQEKLDAAEGRKAGKSVEAAERGIKEVESKTDEAVRDVKGEASSGSDAGEKQPPAEEAGDSFVDDFTDHELRSANSFGYSREVLADMPEEQARVAVGRSVEAQRKADQLMGKLGRALLGAQEAASGEPDETDGRAAKKAGEVAADVKFSPDEWGEEPAAVLNSIPGIQKQLKELSGFVEQERGRREQAAAQEAVREVDAFVAKLDGDVYPFGKGSLDELDEKSDEAQNRFRLAEEAVIWMAGYEAVNKELPSRAEALQRALAVMFPDASKKAFRKELSQKRKLTATSKPSGAKEQVEEPSVEKATKIVEEKMRELNLIR